MVLQIAVHRVFPHLQRSPGHLAENSGIPWNQSTIFHSSQIAKTQQTSTSLPSKPFQSSLDADGKRQRLGEIQDRSSCLAYHLCFAAAQFLTRTVTHWKKRTNRAGDSVNIGDRSLRRVSKANGTIASRPFSDTSRRLLTKYSGNSTR